MVWKYTWIENMEWRPSFIARSVEKYWRRNWIWGNIWIKSMERYWGLNAFTVEKYWRWEVMWGDTRDRNMKGIWRIMIRKTYRFEPSLKLPRDPESTRISKKIKYEVTSIWNRIEIKFCYYVIPVLYETIDPFWLTWLLCRLRSVNPEGG